MGSVADKTAITKAEAIIELGKATGDPERDQVNEGFIEALRAGWLKVTGRGASGDLQFRLTPEGKRHVEEMGKP
jgi:hypothetical protein